MKKKQDWIRLLLVLYKNDLFNATERDTREGVEVKTRDGLLRFRDRLSYFLDEIGGSGIGDEWGHIQQGQQSKDILSHPQLHDQ